MSRVIDAFSQFFDGNGQPLANGTLTFYENGGTTTLQDTYADTGQTIPNANPFQLDGEGRVATDVYGSLLYTVVSKGSNNNVIEQFDNVEPRGGIVTGDTIPDWSSTANYSADNSLVLAGDGEYYIAIQDNMNQNPVTDTTFQYWKRVEFKEEWSEFITYDVKDIKLGSDGIQYESLVGSNLNNDPVGDGGVNWEQYNTNNWSVGRAYLAGEERIADNGRWYKAVINNTGNNPSADDGTNWLPSVGKVDKPSNVLPADTATDVSRTPTLTTSAFAVSGGSDTHEYSVFQLSKDSFVTVDYNSGIQNEDLTSHVVGTTLDGATEYSYRARHRGEFTGLSEWSDVTTFTTLFPLSSFYQTDLITGTGAARTVVNGVDLSVNTGTVFITNIDTPLSNLKVLDTQRGVGNALQPGIVEASEPNGVTSFNSDGYSVGTDADYNGSGNNIFSITIRRQEKIFDVVRYTGTGANRTIAHSLNSPVGLMFCMQEDAGPTASVRSWFSNQSDNNITGLFDGGGEGVRPTAWNSTSPTNSIFSLGSEAQVNDPGINYSMYLFSNNPSSGTASGSYTGTGASGNKITTGFNTGLVIIYKRDMSVATVILSKKLGTSSKIEIFNAQSEETVGGPDSFDSDGFTLGSDSETNQSGQFYYYLAIADENVF